MSPTITGTLLNITVLFPSITLASIQGTTFETDGAAALLARIGAGVSASDVHSTSTQAGSVLLSVSFLPQTLSVKTAQAVAAAITASNPLDFTTQSTPTAHSGTSAAVSISTAGPTPAPTSVPTTSFPTPACPVHGADPADCRSTLVALGTPVVSSAGGFDCSLDATMQRICPAHCNACTASPSAAPTLSPTSPTALPTRVPTSAPTAVPSAAPTAQPTAAPSFSPTAGPSQSPSTSPTAMPTDFPTTSPTTSPVASPSTSPTVSPSVGPSASPTQPPTAPPTISPTQSPSTIAPTPPPTISPTVSPTLSPTVSPTFSPTASPTQSPTLSPTTTSPTRSPTASPTVSPTQCVRGEFLNATTGSCEICTAPGTFMELAEHTSASCNPWSNCSSGEYAATPGTHLVDRTCLACPDGQFRGTTSHVLTFCIDWTRCQQGQHRVASSGNTTSDVVCADCEGGTSNANRDHLDTTCTTCTDGTFAAAGAATCTSHTLCNDGLTSLSETDVYGLKTAGNTTSDNVCDACTLAGRRHVANVSTAGGALCAECPRNTFNGVNPVTFPVLLATASLSIVCTAMANCSAGTRSTYDNTGTNQTADRVCVPCGSFEYMDRVNHTEPACKDHTECNPGFFESVVGSVTSDTVCTAWSLCPAGKLALDDTVVPWFNQNRSCAACDVGKFISNPAHSLKVCGSWRTCGVNEFYVEGSESTTTDRTCTACPVGTALPSSSSHLNTSCVSTAAATAGRQAVTAGVLSAVVIMVVCVLFVMGVLYARARRQARKPEDLARIQEQLRRELGLGSSMTFSEGALGVSVGLEGDVEMILLESLDLEKLVQNHLGVLISRLPGKPMLDEVQFDATSNSALVVLSAAPGVSNKHFDGEKIVAVLDRALRKKPVEMHDIRNGAVIVAVNACQSLPRRVPREIATSKILRLEKLGEGNFAEVFRAQVDERERHAPPYPVAAKVLKGNLNPEIRIAFLREAALMAMLNHENIVKLVGVCTVPADMPPLLLMQFCDRGSLEVFLHQLIEEATEERLNHEAGGKPWGEEDERKWWLGDTVKLTFAGDVCRGLQYLSTCRIVHRDVACRNVLLDAAYICRVADFGMSQALTGDKEYVRMYEQTAVRWAAREVLDEDKFSAASDVWSFGVVLHEITSMAELPYKDLATNTMVIDFITNGGVMERHPLCAPTVYNQLILPCWTADPADRIHYDQLLELIQQLGGSSEASHTDNHGREGIVNVNYTDGPSIEDPGENESAVMSLEDRKLQAPSIWHMNGALRHKLEETVLERPQSLEKFMPDELPALLVKQMVNMYTKPIGADTVCPRDFELGAAYVDTLSGRDNVGRASALLSYSWSNRYFDVCDALTKWVDVNGLDLRRTYIWMCSLCLNQHRIIQVLTPDELSAEFGPRVTSIGRLIPFMDPWDSPQYITRAWCLFEFFTAISLGAKCKVDITLSPGEETRFKEEMVNSGYSKFDAVLSGLSSKNAQASQAADLDAIFKLIDGVPGKFGKIDATAKGHLRRWAAETSGAMRSSHRLDMGGIRDHRGTGSSWSAGATSSSGGPTGSGSNSTPFDRISAYATRSDDSTNNDKDGNPHPKFYTRASTAAGPDTVTDVPAFPLDHHTVNLYSDLTTGSLEERNLLPEIPGMRKHVNALRRQLKKNRAQISALRNTPAVPTPRIPPVHGVAAAPTSVSHTPTPPPGGMRMVTRTKTAGFSSPRLDSRPPSSGGTRPTTPSNERPGSALGAARVGHGGPTHARASRPFGSIGESPLSPSEMAARRHASFDTIRKASPRSSMVSLPPVRQVAVAVPMPTYTEDPNSAES